MKLNLKKTQLVNLSHDSKVLPEELTPQVGGGNATRFVCGGDDDPTFIGCKRTLVPGETCGVGYCHPVF